MFQACSDAVTAAAEAGATATLVPRTFFVAWNGVLTMVYDGFPPGLVEAKAALTGTQALPLKKENFGSKWRASPAAFRTPPTRNEMGALIAMARL